MASTNTLSNRGDSGPGSQHPVPHGAVKVCLRCLLPIELQEEVVQNFLFRASTQPSETVVESKETSSAMFVHATSHKNNCGIDFACAVRIHRCYISLSFLIHTIDIYMYIYMDINPFP